MFKDNRGYTMLEVILGLVILSIMGTVIVFTMFQNQKFISFNSDSDQSINQLISNIETNTDIKKNGSDIINFDIGVKNFSIGVKKYEATTEDKKISIEYFSIR